MSGWQICIPVLLNYHKAWLDKLLECEFKTIVDCLSDFVVHIAITEQFFSVAVRIELNNYGGNANGKQSANVKDNHVSIVQ